MIIEEIQKHFNKVEFGDSTEGVEEIRRLLDHPQMTDDLRFEVAQFLYRYGFLDEALSVMETLHARYPDEPELILTLAELYMEADRNEDALELLRHIDEEEDDAVRAVLLASDIYLSEGLFEVAEMKIKEALQSHSDQPILKQALGEVFYEQEKYALALECFEQSTQPDYAKMADCCAHLGRFEEALAYYEEAMERTETPDLLFGYALVAFQMRKWPSVISALNRLKDADPHYTSLYPFLVEAYMHEGDTERALSVVEEGLKYDDTNARLNELKAKLAIQTGAKHQAKEQLQLALDKDPANIAALEKMALLLKDEGDLEASLRYLERLADISPGRSDIHVHKGLLYEELEQWDKAEQSYRAAVRANAQDTEALNHLAFLLRNEGQVQEALALWRKSLQINPEQEDIRDMIFRSEA